MRYRPSRGLAALFSPAAGLALALLGCGQATPQATAARASAVAAASFQAGRLPTSAELTRSVLRLADTDGAGGPTRPQTGLTAEQFAVLDRDDNGRLGEQDFFKTLPLREVRARLKPFMPFVESTFARLDENADGKLTIAELDGNPMNGEQLRPAAGLSKLPWLLHFVAADANGNQQLERGEFPDFYTSLGAAERPPSAEDPVMPGGGLLGVYLRVTGTLAAWVALHPRRSKVTLSPADFGYAYEDIHLRAADGIGLEGWYIPAATPTDKTVVLVHGFQSNRQLWLAQRVVPMLQGRYNTVMIDLRNHGKSEGTVTSFDYWEHQDVQAAVAYARQRGARSIGVIGQSLGAASSIRAVARLPEVKALVSDCPYATVLSAFQGALSSIWVVPQPALIGAAALAIADAQLGIKMEAAQPLHEVNGLAPRPALFIHGQMDPYIFATNSEILHEAYTGPKQLWLCPKALHGDSDTTDPVGWRERVRGLLDRSL